MRTITVNEGDTLWSLAARHLGSPWRWGEIWAANRIKIEREQARYRRLSPKRWRSRRGPDWIFAGMELMLPAR